MIFGTTDDRPADCDISVGVSVSASISDGLFLYYDVKSNQNDFYILQCSGHFTQILEKKKREQPLLDEETWWTDLPKMTLQELNCVSIPVPRVLSPDEICLQRGLVVNLEGLLAGRLVDQSILDEIFRDDDNLRAILLTAQTRDRVEELQRWLRQFLDPTNMEIPEEYQPDAGATRAIKQMIEETQTDDLDGRRQAMQRGLAAAQQARRHSSQSQIESPNIATKHQRRASHAMLQRSEQGHRRAGSLNSVSYNDPATNPSSLPPPQCQERREKLLNGKFFADASAFRARCPMCLIDEAVMALLLCVPSHPSATDHFPTPGSQANVAYPLALGNFPEVDIVSVDVCCYFCAFYFASEGWTPSRERVRRALPLVAYAPNKAAYASQISSALERRFGMTTALLAFVSILVTSIERRQPPATGASDTAAVEYTLWRESLEWVLCELMRSVACPERLEGVSARKPRGVVEVQLAQNLRQLLDGTSPSLLEYPLEGFVAVILLGQRMPTTPEHSKHLAAVATNTRRKAVWLRLLFELLQGYLQYQSKHGSPATRQRVAELLVGLKSNPTAPTSPQVVNDVNDPTHRYAFLWENRTAHDPGHSTALGVHVPSLHTTPLLSAGAFAVLQPIGDDVAWVERDATLALGIFLHHAAKRDSLPLSNPYQYLSVLRRDSLLKKVFDDPGRFSDRTAGGVKAVGALLHTLPPLLPPGSR
jgi:hypothetical protein